MSVVALEREPSVRPLERVAAVTPPLAKSPRIASLDVVRGIMLIVSVGVNSWITAPAWFSHAPWIGIHPVDWVFPTFVTLSGCGLAFANARRVRLRPILQRAVILFAVGLIYNWVEAGSSWPISWTSLRIPGVLQLYAFVVLVIGCLHFFVKSWQKWAIVTVVFALADSLLIGLWGASCAAGQVTTTCNPSHMIDPAVYGIQHVIAGGQWGYDPEGLPSVFGALVSASLGVTVGHALLAGRRSNLRSTTVSVVSIALGGLALANVLGIWIPAFKKQWTAPFALLISSLTALALLVGHLGVDRTRTTAVSERLRWPLVALGRNSLFVYFGSHSLTNYLNTHGPISHTWFVSFEDHVNLLGHPQASLTILVEALWISLACLLHRRKIYLRP